MLNGIEAFWLWLALACLFFALEAMIVPVGLFLCLGSAAGVIAVLTFFFPSISWLWSLTLFSGLLVLSSWLWWKLLRKRSVSREESALNLKNKQLIGYRAVLEDDLKGGKGRMRVNDSSWLVEADRDYPAGTQVVVTEVKGIVLTIRETN